MNNTERLIAKFRKSANARMKERYGNSIPDYITTLIDQACDCIEICEMCKTELAKSGLVWTNEKGRTFVNPAYSMLQQSQAQFRAALTSLMLTPNSEDKKRQSDKGEQNMLLDELINPSTNRR